MRVQSPAHPTNPLRSPTYGRGTALAAVLHNEARAGDGKPETENG